MAHAPTWLTSGFVYLTAAVLLVPLARALRVAGKIEPVFVESIEDMPGAILSAAQDGDVVITMGAGSIGGVPGKLVNGEA